MLIRNPKAFMRGLLLMGSFIGVFILFFMPVFPAQEGGEKTNGLVYADHMFNTLSKGSANFFDQSLKNADSVNVVIQKVKDTSIDIIIHMKKPEAVTAGVEMVKALGLEAEAKDTDMHVKGSLFVLLNAMVEDAELMYHNEADKVSAKRNMDGKAATKIWWAITSGMIKPLQQKDMVGEATVVNTVMTKALEPSYNFFGITPQRVADNIPLVAGFLIFYVVYTMWYGFAIFELFEGIGLTMKKSVKQEL